MADPRDRPLSELSREELEARCERLAQLLVTRMGVMQEALQAALGDAWDSGYWEAERDHGHQTPTPSESTGNPFR